VPRFIATALALTLVSACLSADRAGGGDGGDGGDGGSADATAGRADFDAAMCPDIFADSFERDSLGADWVSTMAGDGAPEVTVDGALHVAISFEEGDAGGYIGVLTDVRRTLDDTIVTAPFSGTADGDTRAGIAWVTDSADYVAMYIEGAELRAGTGTLGSTPTFLCAPCGDPAPGQVRMRATGATVAFETSPDGEEWDEVATFDTNLDLVRFAVFTEGSTSGAKVDVAQVDWRGPCPP
jgi:hypothetical protein